jgi:hypothetical protein
MQRGRRADTSQEAQECRELQVTPRVNKVHIGSAPLL